MKTIEFRVELGVRLRVGRLHFHSLVCLDEGGQSHRLMNSISNVDDLLKCRKGRAKECNLISISLEDSDNKIQLGRELAPVVQQGLNHGRKIMNMIACNCFLMELDFDLLPEVLADGIRAEPVEIEGQSGKGG